VPDARSAGVRHHNETTGKSQENQAGRACGHASLSGSAFCEFTAPTDKNGQALWQELTS
jgi:hypothetical protein